MATEGKRSKGRFLYLFDWNAKSRKKLFSNKSESFDVEGSSQGNESVDNLAIPNYLLQDLSENVDNSSFKRNGNHSSTSSINGDDGYVTKNPGVVARLMGLDSMPSTTSYDSSSSFASYETRNIGSSYNPKGGTPLESDHRNNIGYNYSYNDSRTTKVHGSPLERFQTEVLPPKSAKPISITHHKLLSPIKSPGFVHTNDATYIIEAASRIIDSSPRSNGRVKIPSFGSPSSSFRIQDLKDKIDAAQRSYRMSESSKTPKMSDSERSNRKSLFKNIMSSQSSSSVKVKGKGKSTPLIVQDNANVKKQDGSTYNERKKMKQKEPITQKVGSNRTPKKKSSSVLRQNNEKQNTVSHKDQSSAKNLVLDQKPRKISQGGNHAGPSKIVSKVYVKGNGVSERKPPRNGVNERRPPLNGVSGRKPPLTSVNEKRPSLNRMKNISRSKELSSKDNRLGKQVLENKDEKDGCHLRKDMDVISFTFTSPIKKTGSHSSSSSEPSLSNNRTLFVDSCDNDRLDMNISSPLPGLSSSLSHLLEQKIRELTDKIGSTKSDLTIEGLDTNNASCLSESLVSHDVGVNSSMLYDDCSDRDQASVICDDDCSSMISQSSHYWEDVDGIEEQSTSSNYKFESNVESHIGDLNVSIPECSFSESLMSSTTTSDATHGIYQPSPRSQEVTSCMSSESVHPIEDESDSINASIYWELEYVRCVLHYANLKIRTLDEDSKTIDPGLFDLLENLINTSNTRNPEPCSKLERKIMFDCICESVNAKFQRASLGSYKSWVKWEMLLRSEWLTEEVYKEILCWQNMGNLMVDELVDCDMSSYYGRWLDFEVESTEEGMDIENEIIESLIDEVLDDLIV